jgi:OOP family OmpA-OmpF porin
MDMKKILLGLSVGAALLMASEYQIGGGIGRSIVSNSPLDNYNFLNLRLGKYLPKNHILRLELEKSQKLSSPLNKSLNRVILNVEHYFTLENSKFTPYAFVGGGYQWLKGPYSNAIIGDAGIGSRYKLKDNLNAFAEVRWLKDFKKNDSPFGMLIGLVYNFGGKKPPVVKDSDKDGVADNLDKCPNTPLGVRVDARGCAIDSDNDGVPDYLDKCPNTPEGVKVDKKGCPIDSDHDGVADYLDKCPNTPEGVKVDKNGCALDSDHDGVADYLDKCPNTPKGFKVDKNGCAITYNFEINFDTDSAKIKPQYMDKIRKFAEFLKSHPEVKAEIQGYTDNRGSKKYNIILSEKRAKAVYEALIKLGVNKSQLSWVGYGPANPVASNDTPEGRAENRRVVAKIIY